MSALPCMLSFTELPVVPCCEPYWLPQDTVPSHEPYAQDLHNEVVSLLREPRLSTLQVTNSPGSSGPACLIAPWTLGCSMKKCRNALWEETTLWPSVAWTWWRFAYTLRKHLWLGPSYHLPHLIHKKDLSILSAKYPSSPLLFSISVGILLAEY